MIQLNRLEGFYWVARTGGYAKAARAFPYPITQPAVHQQVKKLEAEVGVSLFERVGKDRIQLTPAGRRFYEFVAPFYTSLPSVLRSLQADVLGGTLKIHASPQMMRYLLPPWLRRLQRKHAQIDVELRELPELNCTPLLDGDADLLVTHLPVVPEGVEAERVAPIYAFLVLPASHRLAKRKRINVRDLADDTFCGYGPGTYLHELQMEELARHGVQPRRIVASVNAETILGLVETGLGYSLIPHLDRNGPRLRGIVARRLGGRHDIYWAVAAWRATSAGNPLIDAFLEQAPEVKQ